MLITIDLWEGVIILATLHIRKDFYEFSQETFVIIIVALYACMIDLYADRCTFLDKLRVYVLDRSRAACASRG